MSPSMQAGRARRVAVVVLALALASGCSDEPAASAGVVAAAGCLAVDFEGCSSADDTACMAALCRASDGQCALLPRIDGLGCDDGDGCTLGDRCVAGACAAGVDLCECRHDADCKDDGDACNGVAYCDLGGPLGRCAVKPGSVVVCAEQDDDPCTTVTCVPATGACASGAAADKTACEDGDVCTAGDRCEGGVCAAGVVVCQCESDADCPDDDDLCNGQPYCDKAAHACKTNPATVVSCDKAADTACTASVCDPGTGTCALAPRPPGTLCDDGDACSAGDFCVAGVCKAGVDVCLCKSDADCKALDDGNLCNGVAFCDLGDGACKTNPATVVACPTVDDTACVKTVCVPKTGACAAHAREDVVQTCATVAGVAVCGYALAGDKGDAGPFGCEDGDGCTAGDVCKGKLCAPGKTVCECQSDADCTAQDDGDLCNGTLYCDALLATCKPNPASVVYCSPANDTACLATSCDKTKGTCSLQPRPAGAPCQDGEPCTDKDTCDKGVCKPGGPAACDDGEPCTVDSCVAGKGCSHVAKLCDDGNDCTSEVCDGKTGQCSAPAALAKGKACDGDQQACTAGDACDGAGSCVVGAAVVCKPPASPCLEALCQAAPGGGYACVEVAKAGEVSCDDGKGCLGGAHCQAGVCKPGDVPRLFVATVTMADAAARYSAVTTSAAGELVSVGAVGKPATKPALWSWIFEVRSSEASASQQVVLDVVAPTPAGGAIGVHRDGGTYYLAGTGLLVGDKSGGGADVVVARVDGAGKAAWVKAVAGGDGEQYALASAFDAGVGLLVAGRVDKGGVSLPIVRRVDGEGAVLADGSKAFAGVEGRSATAIAVVGDKRLAVGTSTDAALGGDAGQRVYVLDANGAPLFWVRLPVPALRGVGALIDLPGGDFLALGATDAASGGKLVSARVSENQAEAHASILPTPLIPRAVVRHGKGALFAVGDVGDGVKPEGHLVGLDVLGNLHWSSKLAPDGSASARGVAVAADGKLVVAGAREVGGKERAVVGRASAFGHFGCESAGLCLDVAPGGCDDGVACSKDGCDPLSGCTHDATAKLACAVDNGCSASASCDNGACVPSAEGALGARLLGGEVFAGNGPVYDARFVDGRPAVLLPKTDGTAISARVAMQLGEVHDLEKLDLCQAAESIHAVRASVLYPGKRFVAATVGSGAGAVARFCRDGDKAGVYTVAKPCASCGTFAVDVAELPNGGYWSLARVLTSSLEPIALARHTPEGYAAVKLKRGKPGTSTAATALVGMSDGLGVVVGYRASGVKNVGYVVAAEAGYSDVDRFEVDIAAPSGHLTLHAGAAAANGDILLGGLRWLNDVSQYHALVRLDSKGKTKWTAFSAQPDLAQIRQIAERADGSLLAATTSLSVPSPTPRVVAYAPDGVLLWTRTYAQADGAPLKGEAAGLALDASGGFALFARHDGAPYELAVVRADAWGHASCADAGGCVGKPASGCDDDNACTVDLCDAKGGCEHVPVSGLACGVGKVCGAGVCK